jgi:catechol 2,3-dioxygenase-like lactoylglutathione lyase family enzyme
MIHGLHHVALSTANIDRLVKFYCDVLGFEVVAQAFWPKGSPDKDAIVGMKDSSAKMRMIRAGNCFIEVFQYESPKGKPIEPNRPAADLGYTHFCLNVTDIDYEYERLKKAGVTFHCAPAPKDASRPIRATYARDPDGNIFELLEVFSPDFAFAMENVELERA